MIFKRITPSKDLNRIIDCYWIVENEETTPRTQKIIPDGFCEIIFHYKDPYRICLNGGWELQTQSLLAGQLRQYFFLENTGASGMIGIKLQPTALTHLFQLDMHTLTGQVANLPAVLGKRLAPLEQTLRGTSDHEKMIQILDDHFTRLAADITDTPSAVDEAINLIFAQKGMITVGDITARLHVSERHLERLFAKYIGLSPKFYARIIRFSAIFQLIQQENPGWIALACEAGFYDQSHFIRNFKAFTGEDPSQYGFDEKNMANFFLKKK